MTNDDRDEKKNQQKILANLQNSSLLQNDPIHGEVVLAPANQNRQTTQKLIYFQKKIANDGGGGF